MYHFKYVTKKQLSPVKKNLVQLIYAVRDQVRRDFTFQFKFVGSVKRNMVTYDPKTNIGYDFDVNIEVNDDDENFTAKEIRTIIRNALDKVAPHYGYDHAEDSTRVITIKIKDISNSRILHSCDFAIVNNYTDKYGNNRQEYIRFNKRQGNYTWEEQPKGFYLLDKKAAWIKSKGYWNKVTMLYLEKINANRDLYKHSRSIFAETVHQVCQELGYYE